MTKTTTEDASILDKLDELVPAPLAQFDAFPKLPATYKARSESRGFLTLFVAFAAFLLVLNDLGEFIWGWPDYEFGVDIDKANTMDINVDMVVNMPCQCECQQLFFCSQVCFAYSVPHFLFPPLLSHGASSAYTSRKCRSKPLKLYVYYPRRAVASPA